MRAGDGDGDEDGGSDKQGARWIAALSLMAALQLGAEAARDIIPYPYPMHDLRLSLILLFAMGVGVSFAGYVLLRLFAPHRRRRLLALAVLGCAMIGISAWQPGFDLKTAYVLALSCLFAALAGLFAVWRGQGNLLWPSFAGLGLAALITWLGGFFIDTLLYLVIAGFLLWLFFKHAKAPAITRPPKAEPEGLKRIELASNGKVEFVPIDEIVRFGGAGDYVEVFLSSGRTALHNASLAALERELPAGFIRVHRSHIVNAACVASLVRASAGTGELHMSDGSQVPVSRRNMASVRDALTER